MTKCDVAVFDDDPEFAKEFVTAAQSGIRAAGLDWQVKAIEGPEVKEWIRYFIPEGESRPKAPPAAKDPWKNCRVVLIDADLRRSLAQTAEKLAYWSRCYSNVGAIVSLNPEPHRTFDLHLRETPSVSWTDLGVYLEDLRSPELWAPKAQGNRYRPWYWPALPDLAERRKQLNDEATEALPFTLAEFLKIPEEMLETFPKRLFDAYVPRLTERLSAIARSRLHKADARIVNDEGRGRIAAATVRWWLENVLLPSQDILIDPPHLVSRFPSLLGRRRTAAAANALGVPTGKLPSAFSSPNMRKHRFAQENWLDRPAWWFPRVSSDESIPEVADPRKFEELPFVFAEDTSRFVREKSCKKFTLAGAGIFSRRYIRRPPGAPSNYDPAGNLLGA